MEAIWVPLIAENSLYICLLPYFPNLDTSSPHGFTSFPHPLPLSLQVKLLLPPQNGTGHSQPSRSTSPRVHPRYCSPRRLGRNAPHQALLNRQEGYRAGARAVQRP